MGNKVLHIAGCDKFIPPFVEFVRRNFEFSQHEFLLTNGMGEKELKTAYNVRLAKRTASDRLKHYGQAIVKMHQADKVILHGLFDIQLVALLFFMPWLLKKCYWLVWGGDLYVHQLGEKNWQWKRKEFFRRKVIRNMGAIVTSIEGDYANIVAWYQARGKWLKLFTYPSSLYVPCDKKEAQGSECLNILVGNSADPTNQHVRVFEKLKNNIPEKAKVYVPLSYGDEAYRKKVLEKGEELLGEQFLPLINFLPLDEYNAFLNTIDVAVFAHKRQQALSNIRTLLGMGKKVYMNPDSSAYGYLTSFGLVIFDFNSLGVMSVGFDFSDQNSEIIEKVFSESKLISNLERLFNE